MNIQELYETLKKLVEEGHGKDPVYFDTEAQCYRQHVVSIDLALYEEHPKPHLELHENAPHRSGHYSCVDPKPLPNCWNDCWSANHPKATPDTIGCSDCDMYEEPQALEVDKLRSLPSGTVLLCVDPLEHATYRVILRGSSPQLVFSLATDSRWAVLREISDEEIIQGVYLFYAV